MELTAKRPAVIITAGHMQQWLHARNCHDVSQIQRLLADEVCMHQPWYQEPVGKADIGAYFTALFQAYPDIQVETEGFLIGGYEVACRERLSGTLTGRFPEMQATSTNPATDRTFVLPCAIWLTYQSDGMITSIRMYWDWSLLLRLPIPQRPFSIHKQVTI